MRAAKRDGLRTIENSREMERGGGRQTKATNREPRRFEDGWRRLLLGAGILREEMSEIVKDKRFIYWILSLMIMGRIKLGLWVKPAKRVDPNLIL